MYKRAPSTSVVVFVGAAAVGFGILAGLLRPLRRDPPEVMPGFRLDRYMGRWFEIARTPNRFERGCTDTVAYYGHRPDGTVEVFNGCRRGRRLREIRGVAWARDPAEPARLTVRFRWPLRGDYQVLYVDGDYRVAVVGDRRRRRAWILCREPMLDDETYAMCLGFLADQGFDPSRLARTRHASGPATEHVWPTATATP